MGEGTEENIFAASLEYGDRQSNRQFFLKYEFYHMSLTFTVLALSIQTANFQKPIIANNFELSAWIMFILSGFFALFKLKKYHSYFGWLDYYLSPLRQAGKKVEKNLFSNQKIIISQTIIQWIFFISGFIALIISRGYEPFMKIIE